MMPPIYRLGYEQAGVAHTPQSQYCPVLHSVLAPAVILRLSAGFICLQLHV